MHLAAAQWEIVVGRNCLRLNDQAGHTSGLDVWLLYGGDLQETLLECCSWHWREILGASLLEVRGTFLLLAEGILTRRKAEVDDV